MSDNRKQNQRGNNAILSTLAAVGVGALAAAGAFFVGKALGEEETEARLTAQQYHQQQRQQRETLAASRAHHTRSPAATSTENHADDDDPKQSLKREKECVICMSPLEELTNCGVEIHTTPCGHIFCAGCIERALRRTHECPTCRQTVLPGQTLRIFL